MKFFYRCFFLATRISKGHTCRFQRLSTSISVCRLSPFSTAVNHWDQVTAQCSTTSTVKGKS